MLISPFEGWDDLWRWVLLTMLCFGPLVFIGIGTGCGFAVVLGAIGFMIDVGRLSIYVNEKANTKYQFLARFTVFAVGGISIGTFGYWLNQYQILVEEWLKTVLAWQPTHLSLSESTETTVTEVNASEKALLLPVDGKTMEDIADSSH